MSRLVACLFCAATLMACADADSGDAAPDVPVLESAADGGVVGERLESGVVRSLDLGEQWCDITYDDDDGELQAAQGYRALCDRTDVIGQPVRFGVTTFEGMADCEDGEADCGIERRDIVNVFLTADAVE